MWKLLMGLLPADKKALLELALRITANLDTPEERKRVADYGIEMLSASSAGGTRVTVAEWSAFGKKLGVFKKGK